MARNSAARGWMLLLLAAAFLRMLLDGSAGRSWSGQRARAGLPRRPCEPRQGGRYRGLPRTCCSAGDVRAKEVMEGEGLGQMAAAAQQAGAESVLPPAELAPAARGLPLRGYQEECLRTAVRQNSIVVLPTGTGKTLIAVKVIDHFRALAPEKCVLFLVPTKALVGQQAEYCRSHCAVSEPVRELCGMEMDGCAQLHWTEITETKLLVGTPEVFRRALDKGYLRPEQISLLIFDECHNAVGNLPMAAFMRLLPSPGPRILGLTASFFMGTLKDPYKAEMAKIELEALLQSTLICPTVPAEATFEKQWQRVDYQDQHLGDEFQNDVNAFVQDLVERAVPSDLVKDFDGIGRRLLYVLSELGMDAFKFAVRHNLIPQLESSALLLLQAEHPRVVMIEAALPDICEKLLEFHEPPQTHVRLAAVPAVTKKVEALFNLLQQRQGKGIVFVDQVILTLPLANSIETLPGWKALGVYGRMVESDQEQALEEFRSGRVQVLVATNTLEEGIDVSDCEWVVRFSLFHTTKAHIQGSGRARSSPAEVFYFNNTPSLEQARADAMRAVAEDAEVTASANFRARRRELAAERAEKSKGVHPWHSPGYRNITFSNGLEIVLAWCQKVLQNDFHLAGLLLHPDGEGWRIPGPGGPIEIRQQDVHAYWGNVSLRDAVDPEVLQPLKQKDKERRRTWFVLAIRLQQLECLDSSNTPRAEKVLMARQNAASFPPRPASISVGSSYPRRIPLSKQQKNGRAQPPSFEPTSTARLQMAESAKKAAQTSYEVLGSGELRK